MFGKRRQDETLITRTTAEIARSNIRVMHDSMKYNGQILFKSGTTYELEETFGDAVKAYVALREKAGDEVVGASIVQTMPQEQPKPPDVLQMPGNSTIH